MVVWAEKARVYVQKMENMELLGEVHCKEQFQFLVSWHLYPREFLYG